MCLKACTHTHKMSLRTSSLAQIVQILNRLQEKDELLLFYEHMQTVAEAALSEELSYDSSHPAQALREVLEGLARAACTWASEEENAETEEEDAQTEGSGSDFGSEESRVDCNNMTDIVRYAREKEIDFIFSKMQDVNVSRETLSLALRLRPTVNKTQFYLRNEQPDIQPDAQHKKDWVTRNISPANRCYVCQAAV